MASFLTLNPYGQGHGLTNACRSTTQKHTHSLGNLMTSFRLNGVSKSFKIYKKPIDRVIELVLKSPRHDIFHAIQPIDLEIPKGTCLGIVGDNGAGKSTLMHLLAGTLTPTSGTIERNGKTLALLELEVGFHPEFTGRENIFFRADLLGIDRKHIKSKIDEIIEFSELDHFIDQPIKTYSTGMRVRLGFSLLTSLDPDNLIIDEALSVGDIHFQKKCIDRITRFKEQGKTIIFCSHSLYQVREFCESAIWIDKGKIRMNALSREVIQAYEAHQLKKSCQPELCTPPPSQKLAHISKLNIFPSSPMDEGTDLVIEVETDAPVEFSYHVTISLKMESGRGIFVIGTHFMDHPPLMGPMKIRATFPRIQLMGGNYIVHARLLDDQALILIDEDVHHDLVIKNSTRELGIVRLPFQIETNPIVSTNS